MSPDIDRSTPESKIAPNWEANHLLRRGDQRRYISGQLMIVDCLTNEILRTGHEPGNECGWQYGGSLVAQWRKFLLPMQETEFDAWSGRIPHTAELLTPCAAVAEPALYSSGAAVVESRVPPRSPQWEAQAPWPERSQNREEPKQEQRGPSTAERKKAVQLFKEREAWERGLDFLGCVSSHYGQRRTCSVKSILGREVKLSRIWSPPLV